VPLAKSPPPFVSLNVIPVVFCSSTSGPDPICAPIIIGAALFIDAVNAGFKLDESIEMVSLAKSPPAFVTTKRLPPLFFNSISLPFPVVSPMTTEDAFPAFVMPKYPASLVVPVL